jgi:CheY-like chemotaxis protein
MRAISSVLVIDDNPDTLETLVALLGSLGVERVTQATTAEDALQMVKMHQFSVILADYRLEGMDGVQFVEQLRAAGDQTPVIMLSGAPDKSGVIRATSQTKVDFFAKPFRVADLMVAMDRMAA